MTPCSGLQSEPLLQEMNQHPEVCNIQDLDAAYIFLISTSVKAAH